MICLQELAKDHITKQLIPKILANLVWILLFTRFDMQITASKNLDRKKIFYDLKYKEKILFIETKIQDEMMVKF